MSLYPLVQLSSDSAGHLLVCAVRYALGRQTYMPALVCDIGRGILTDIPGSDLRTILHDIDEHTARRAIGAKWDEPSWLDFRGRVAAEIAQRQDRTQD